MAMFDLVNNIAVEESIAPAAQTANVNGTGIDLRGYNAVAVIVDAGTITDGTHAISLEESDDDSTYTAVAASDLQGSFSNVASNTPQKVGYIGTKRYIRAVATVSGATTGGVYGVAVIKGRPEVAPV